MPDPQSNPGVGSVADSNRQEAGHDLVSYPLRNTSDAIRLLDEDQPSASFHPVLGRASVAYDTRLQFFLLQEGLIEEPTLFRLFRFYLGAVHPVMPLIPNERFPRTPEQILAMAAREPHFMAAILVVAAGLLGEYALHRLLWQRVERLFSQVAIRGEIESLELLEALLLLSEFPPNMGYSAGLRSEDRMCWMTVGTAVRLGYLLGLEQLVMLVDDVDEKAMVDDKSRGKVVWSYCFLLDRQISIRCGKAFWHRSPGMTAQHFHSDPAEDFPQMRLIGGSQDDYAAYLQCLMHLTQILSNAHDLLYSSKSHSLAIARAELYYRHIDSMTDALATFRTRWQNKLWQTYPINECVWISYHHLRLYIYSFSLQGHMQRAEALNNGQRLADYFPTGLMGSVDARFIIEAINSAADILRLAIDRLYTSGALRYLPLRFFLILTHAGVFLLKAVSVCPLPPSQRRAIFHLIRGLIKAMATASSDAKHPAVRNSSALDRLLRRIHRDHRDAGESADPTRPTSPSNLDGNMGGLHNTATPFPMVLGGGVEAPFVAELPLPELAADIDAAFGLPELNNSMTMPPESRNMDFDPPSMPASDIFASLFNYDDRDFWGEYAPAIAGN